MARIRSTVTVGDDGQITLHLDTDGRSATLTTDPQSWRRLIDQVEERLPIDLLPAAMVPGCPVKVASKLVDDLIEGDQFRFSPTKPWHTITRIYRVHDCHRAETATGNFTFPAGSAVQVNLVGRSALLAAERSRTTQLALEALVDGSAA